MNKRVPLTFEQLVAPMLPEVFKNSVAGKKPMVIRATEFKKDFFGKIITWGQISDYVANDRAVAGLQMITPNREKLCMEKENLFRGAKPAWSRKDRYEKKYVQEIWNSGGSMILTKASMLTPHISAIANALESEFKNTAADAHFYCSPVKNAISFECHADGDDNYLIHAIGDVHWKVYNKFAQKGEKRTMTDIEEKRLNPIIDTTLTVGDLIYIPEGMFHRATPMSARVSISVPLAKNALHPIDRNYYDFGKNNS